MSSYYQSYPSAPDPNLQFYSSAPPTSASQASSFYQGRPSLDPGARPAVAGTIGGRPGAGPTGGQVAGGPSGSTVGLTGPIIVANWYNAFTPWTGMEGEVPLLEGGLRAWSGAEPRGGGGEQAADIRFWTETQNWESILSTLSRNL